LLNLLGKKKDAKKIMVLDRRKNWKPDFEGKERICHLGCEHIQGVQVRGGGCLERKRIGRV